MTSSVLSRYLNPEVLAQVADRPIEPRSLVLGNLAGSHKSPLAGFAVEFAGHREYVIGDDPRHIDWRVALDDGEGIRQCQPIGERHHVGNRRGASTLERCPIQLQPTQCGGVLEHEPDRIGRRLERRGQAEEPARRGTFAGPCAVI